MAKTYQEYRKLLQSLLPKGAFWSKSESSTFTQLLSAFGEELARVEQRGEDLINETFSGTISELFTEWEIDFNIPVSGFNLAYTTENRRAEIKTKIIAVGQQNKEYFLEIASALGYTITITEFEKSLAGVITPGSSIISEDKCIFYWLVNIWVSDRNDAYIADLIYNIEQKKPAHTIVLFRFYNVGFSNGFDNGFDAVPWWDGSFWPLGFDRSFSIGFANNSDYIGIRLLGSFSNGFSEGFNSYRGGGFDFNGFSDGFIKPS